MSNGIYTKLYGYHNRRSIRLTGYDYSSPGYYFVTVCIHDRKQNLFGDVSNGRMVTNKFGEFVEKCWCEIPKHFPHVILDEFTIMPNHVHGIIQIYDGSVVVVGANNHSPLQQPQQPIQPIRPQKSIHHIEYPRHPRGTSKTIGSIIRGFKIGVTKLIRQQIPGMPVWQRNYYEHIVRNGKSLLFIRKYIRENPVNWVHDSETHIDREIVEFHLTETGGRK